MGLTIIQHNVMQLTGRKADLMAQYYDYNPDVILLNSIGNISDIDRSTKYYNTLVKKVTKENSDGSMIMIKKGIQYKELDTIDSESRFQLIELTHRHIPIRIVTGYFPKSEKVYLAQQLKKFTDNFYPVLIAADFNAEHSFLGWESENVRGLVLNTFVQKRYLQLLGPDFETINGEKGKSDIVLHAKTVIFPITIHKGPPTVSDHAPMIIKIDEHPRRMARMGQQLEVHLQRLLDRKRAEPWNFRNVEKEYKQTRIKFYEQLKIEAKLLAGNVNISEQSTS